MIALPASGNGLGETQGSWGGCLPDRRVRSDFTIAEARDAVPGTFRLSSVLESGGGFFPDRTQARTRPRSRDLDLASQ